jgi:hypothetical protein
MKSTFLRLFFLTVCATSLHAQNFSLQFDGDDDHAVFPECTAMTAPSFTIEGWFKCTPNFEPQTILMSFLDIPDKNANVTLEVRQNGLVRFNFRSVATVLGGEELSSTTAVADNVWHHFAVVKEGDTRLWLYIDGFPEVVTCGFYEPVSETPIFELGRNRYDPAANYRFFRGNLDDIKIWQRAKNCREIFEDYKNESSGLESGLFGNYKFDLNADTVYDCSPNKRHGKRQGALGLNNLPKYVTDVPPLVDKMCEVQLVGVEEELSAPNQGLVVAISPNPVREILHVEIKGAQKVAAQIYASDGRLVREILILDGIHTVDVSSLPSGTYLLKLGNAEVSKTLSFIKI